MKKNVAVIYGGDSSEVEVSIRSGRYAASVIDRAKYNVYEVFLKGSDWKVVRWEEDLMRVVTDVDKNDFSAIIAGKRIRFKVACIMIHGTPGENGKLQGYLEMMGVHFTTCPSFCCTTVFNKYSCKTFLRDLGVGMARESFLRRGDRFNARELVEKLGLPLFVKPCDGGSSFGITKVKRIEELDDAIYKAFKESDTIMVEEALGGREMTQGAYLTKDRVVTLPIIEIVPEGEFFDYEAKYLGRSREICPADISPEAETRISETTNRIYRYFGCRGLIRIDYFLDGDKVWFLEINTAPGMTSTSLVPQMLREAGIDISDFFTQLIENA